MSADTLVEDGRIPDCAANFKALKVMLIGNYAHDGCESMRRFTNMFVEHLPHHGIDVRLGGARPLFGRLKVGASGLGKWLGYIDKFIVFPNALRAEIAKMQSVSSWPKASCLVHVCDHSNAHYIRYLNGISHVVTCHDLLAVRSARREFQSTKTSWTGQVLQRMILSGLRRAQKIVCDSLATRSDLLRLTGKREQNVPVINCGLNYQYKPVQRFDGLNQVSAAIGRLSPEHFPQFPFPYILHVGGAHWYKNRLGVLRIYFALHRQMESRGIVPPKLVMVGPFPTNESRTLSPERSWEDVVVLPGVSNEELQAIYSRAEVLLFPSLEEGFGWPIIEAQACGCRVVTTDKPPMTEVGGNAAVYLRPEDVQGISHKGEAEQNCERVAEQMQQVLNEDAQSRAMRSELGLQNASRFSARRMIDEYVALYRSLGVQPYAVRAGA